MCQLMKNSSKRFDLFQARLNQENTMFATKYNFLQQRTLNYLHALFDLTLQQQSPFKICFQIRTVINGIFLLCY